MIAFAALYVTLAFTFGWNHSLHSPIPRSNHIYTKCYNHKAQRRNVPLNTLRDRRRMVQKCFHILEAPKRLSHLGGTGGELNPDIQRKWFSEVVVVCEPPHPNHTPSALHVLRSAVSVMTRSCPVKIDPVQIGFLRIKSIYLPISGHLPCSDRVPPIHLAIF